VILAMGDGKDSARAIDSWLRGVWPPEPTEQEVAAAAAEAKKAARDHAATATPTPA
jgi:hypothetical protein